MAENGDSFWKMLSRDNATSIFGKTENSRIFDPETPSQIFEWLLSETFNAKGDRVVYEYKSEYTDNVPNTLHEINCTQTANKYIEKITYGNVRPFQPLQQELEETDQWHFEVVFDYGQYNLDANDST
ncbi:MAG: SpvB/TcaC N-terminal domain-containing protein, partial [Xenococcaceae cyanobacterium]